MPKTELIQVRIDPELRSAADAIYKSLGMDLSTAIRLFLKQTINHGNLPFDLKLGNDVPEEVMRAYFGITDQNDTN